MTIKEQILEHEKESIRLQELLKLFPDLHERKNRWKRSFLSSKEVNSQATDVEIGHSCGCCEDSSLFVYPFIETEYGKVFSDPYYFCVGSKNVYGTGENPDKNWEEKLQKENISQIAIDAVTEYLKNNIPKNDDDEDDDDF